MISADIALKRARALCARQERCRSELRLKLEAWGVANDEIPRLLGRLEKEGFLDEGRFAEHYAVSKFRQKGWGRVKIRHALQQKQLGSTEVAKGMKAIDQEEYVSTLRSLVKKCWVREKGRERYEREQRVLRHLMYRGFEADLVRMALPG